MPVHAGGVVHQGITEDAGIVEYPRTATCIKIRSGLHKTAKIAGVDNLVNVLQRADTVQGMPAHLDSLIRQLVEKASVFTHRHHSTPI